MTDEWFVAQDTFCAELPGGGQQTVQKGSTWHRSEHVVQLDAGRNVLFQPQRSGAPDEAAGEPAPKTTRSRRKSPAPADESQAAAPGTGMWDTASGDGGGG